jgi:excisionase family DNA binding protein
LELGGVSKPTVYALVNRGELQKVNIGRRGFITTASLTAYVERLAKTAAREQRKAAVASRIAGLDATSSDGAA